MELPAVVLGFIIVQTAGLTTPAIRAAQMPIVAGTVRVIDRWPPETIKDPVRS